MLTILIPLDFLFSLRLQNTTLWWEHYHGSHSISLTAPSLSSWLAILLPPASQISSLVHFTCCVLFTLYILSMGNCTHCRRFSWHSNSEYTGDFHVYYSNPNLLPKSQYHNHNSQLTFTTLSTSKTLCLEHTIFPHHKSTPPPKYAISFNSTQIPIQEMKLWSHFTFPLSLNSASYMSFQCLKIQLS